MVFVCMYLDDLVFMLLFDTWYIYRFYHFSGRFTRRGSTDTAADADSLSAKHSHSHHSLLRDMPDHSNSHSDNTVKEGKEKAGMWSNVIHVSSILRPKPSESK